LGNSIVRQSINQPEPRFTGTIDTSKLDAKLAQQFGSDFDKATDKQISQIANQTAENLSQTALQNLPTTNFADIDTFASSAAGLSLATNFVAGAQQNEVAIRNFITTTNQNRAEAANARAETNYYRNRRYSIGDAQARADMDRFNYLASRPSVAEQERWVYQRDQAMGGFGDFLQGVGEGFVDSIYQGVQFIGTSLAAISPVGQGISYMSGNGPINPFATDYHSMFDSPTTVNQSGGRFVGELLSLAAGGEGLLVAGSKFGRVSNVTETISDPAVAARRAYLNNRFGRTGSLHADINIRGNRETAENFYRNSGYSDLDMQSHLNGIDFTQPVEVVKIGKGQRFYQWDSPTTFRGGEYFAVSANSTPSQLGINPSKVGFGTDIVFTRSQTPLFTDRAVYGLRSTAAPINDFWSVPRQSFMTEGGAMQLFTRDNAAFRLNSTAFFGY